MKSAFNKLVRVLSWLISAALSIRLFTCLSTDVPSGIILAGLAVALEAGKLRAVHTAKVGRKPLFVGLAIALVLISLLASTGSALVLIEERRAVGRIETTLTEQKGTAYELALAEIKTSIPRSQQLLENSNDTG